MAGRSELPQRSASRSPRDRYIDLLRVASLSMVVIGHWLAVHVSWEGGTVTGENALDLVPDMWPLTWAFQVMPLFFFVGGFANRKSYESVCRRGGGYVAYATRRLVRLLVPTLAFLAVGLATATILDAADLIEDLLRPAARVVTLPLWFLGVYLIVLALAPPMLMAHRRHGMTVVVALGGGAVLVDLIRFGLDVESVGYLNYAFVWLLVHQLGFVYADGAIEHRGPVLFIIGCVSLVGLTALGPYPASLVGIASDEIDNMNPPTLPILALAAGQFGAAMIARVGVTKWLERARVWTVVVALNQRIMTVFLWHLAAVLPTIAIIYPLGFPQPDPGGITWWALRPAWIVLQIPVLVVLVLAFGPFEGVGRRFAIEVRTGAETLPGRFATGLGAFYAGLGVVGYARLGLEPVYSDLTKDVTIIDVTSARSLIHLLLGMVLVASAIRGSARAGSVIAAVALGALALFGGISDGVLSTNPTELALHAVSAVALAVVPLFGRAGRQTNEARSTEAGYRA